jgi:hypothetical protein
MGHCDLTVASSGFDAGAEEVGLYFVKQGGWRRLRYAFWKLREMIGRMLLSKD